MSPVASSFCVAYDSWCKSELLSLASLSIWYLNVDETLREYLDST